FLNYFPVAADRSVKPLQVAVDDPDQVVEVLAGGQSKRAQRFRLVCLAISNESPDFGFFAGDKAARAQVTIEPGLIDREQRSKPHGNSWKLPELGHEIGMGIG